MGEKIQSVLADLRRRFESLYGPRMVRLILYGSHARGDAEPGSDIDVLVVLRGTVSPCEEIARTLDEVAAVSLDNDEVVSCVFLSETHFNGGRGPLLLNVRREGVAV